MTYNVLSGTLNLAQSIKFRLPQRACVSVNEETDALNLRCEETMPVIHGTWKVDTFCVTINRQDSKKQLGN